MRLKKYGQIAYLIFIILLLSFCTSGCDKYQSESFEISATDATACAQIQDTLFNSVSTVNLTTFNSTWTDENVSQNVQEIIDSLIANDIVVRKDDLSTWVTTGGALDTNYVCLLSNSNSVTLYSDRIINLKLMDAQGDFRSISSISMPLETVGGCLTETGNPLIKTRIEYSTPDEEYLFYLINEETTFPADEEDFIIILSIQ
jgi:hypothetical protein